MNKIFFLLFISLFSQQALSGVVPIQDRINTYNFYYEIYPIVFGEKEFAHEETFVQNFQSLNQSKKDQVLNIIEETSSFIPKDILRPLIYWKIINPNNKNVSKTISFFMFYKLLTIRDYLDDPYSSNKKQALELLREVTQDDLVDEYNLYSRTSSNIFQKANLISTLSGSAFTEALRQTEIISQNFNVIMPDLPQYVLNYMGIIPGNKVKVISYNDTSKKRIDWFNDRVIFAGGSLDMSADYIKVPTADDLSGHISMIEDPIFKKITEMISKAEDSIFIDIFLFGGTLGATIAEHLVDQTLKKRKMNPDFKTIIMHDYATNYNMKDEMMPVFHYIKKRIDTEIEVRNSLFLLQANIQRHPPGIPFGITNLIPKNEKTFKFIENQSTYFESKIDHSKVIVIDANTENAAAYFGSKNWSDHSGGYYYDDAIYVEGPAAALVQASYFRDIDASLTTDPKEQAWFYYKEMGLDNKLYIDQRDEILKRFSVTKNFFNTKGDDPVRIAEADVDGTIKNARNILIDMIVKAEKNIYMEQLFIYDPYIVNALIKKKIQNPTIDIKILADHNGNFGLNGLPNTLYLKRMIENGIEVRARKTMGVEAHFPNGTTKEYHQENHRKITSVDGRYLLGGSSNLNPDTLQGSFREFGAQIFNRIEIEQFERKFMSAWNNSSKTMNLDVENFQVKIGEKYLGKRISAIINALGSKLLEIKDKLEERF